MTDDSNWEDEIDGLLEGGYTPQGAKERFRRKAQTEGLDIAYAALINILTDPKAQATARATAGGLILKSAGVLSKKFEEEGESDDGGFGKASKVELEAMLKQLRAKRRKLERQSKDGGDGGESGSGGVFD